MQKVEIKKEQPIVNVLGYKYNILKDQINKSRAVNKKNSKYNCQWN